MPAVPTLLSGLQQQVTAAWHAFLVAAQEHQAAAAVTFIVGLAVGTLLMVVVLGFGRGSGSGSVPVASVKKDKTA